MTDEALATATPAISAAPTPRRNRPQPPVRRPRRRRLRGRRRFTAYGGLKLRQHARYVLRPRWRPCPTARL
ncbi:MAG: hypothetical protein ACLUHE_02090 [Christensenellales bacterium]